MELARLECLGEVDNMNVLLMEIIQRLSLKAMELDEYTDGLELQPHNLPAIISLPEFLNDVFSAISESGILLKELTKEQFLEGFLSESYPEPAQLANYLKSGSWVRTCFDMSYLMVLICQTCIRKELELTRLIAECVAYLKVLNTPRQNVQKMQEKFQLDSQMQTKKLLELYQKTTGDQSKNLKERISDPSPQSDVEDLLSKFGM